MTSQTKWGIFTILFTASLDQLSKWAVLTYLMTPPQVVEVMPHLNLVLTFNTGIAFGLLEGWPVAWLLIGIACVLIYASILWKQSGEVPFMAVSFGMIFGGALGNIIDRIHFGAVMDFIDIYYDMANRWPTFNLADAFLTFGVALLFIGDGIYKVRLADPEYVRAENARRAAREAAKEKTTE